MFMRTYCVTLADLRGRAGKGVGLRPLAYWDCGFETRQRHGCPSLVCAVGRQAEVCVGLITRPEESYQV